MIKSKILLIPLAVSMALYGGAIHAEEADDEEDSNVIIITASKRPTSLQATPIAITVISEEAITQTNIQDIQDLQALVPTLRVTPLQRSTNTGFALRGFANGTNNTGIEPSVGIFIDGVYRSRAAAQIGDLPRLDQIEVLSGPQSTLFGKNASAGVVNIRTKAPSFDLEGKVQIGVGNYNQQLVKAYVTNSISDNVAFSLSAVSSTRDGYTKSIANGLGDLNDRDRTSLRGQLLWEPTDNVSLRLIADMSEIDEVCCTVSNFADGPVAPVMNFFAGGVFLDSATPFSYESALNFNPTNKVEDSGVSLEANVEYDTFTFTSITASRTNDSTSLGDVDFSAADLLSETTAVDIDTFTQEFRLTSTGENTFDWMVGVFIFQEDIDSNDSILFGTQARAIFDTLFGGPAAIAGAEGLYANLGYPAGWILQSEAGAFTNYTQSNDAFSIFATFDYKFTDQLTATLGLSYTDDEKEVTVSQVNTDRFSAIDFGTTPTDVFGLPITALGLDPAYLAGLGSLQFLQPMLALPNAVEDGTSSDDDVTWSLRLAYEVNENVNVFATASTGFKATSWNLSRDTRPLDDANERASLIAAGLARGDQEYGTRFAGPETSEVFEIGMKTRFEKGAFNVTIFDQSIEGFQSSTFAGTGFVLANAGNQSTKGLEFDVIYTPTDNWTLSLAGSFLDPTYDSFVGGSGVVGVDGPIGANGRPTGVVDLTGETPAGIHEQSIVAGIKYDFELSSGSYAYVRTDYLYESEVRTVRNTPESLTREVGTINASAGITLLNGVNVQLWVRNLNNDEYFMSSFPTPIQNGSFSAYPNQPRTYGASVSYEF